MHTVVVPWNDRHIAPAHQERARGVTTLPLRQVHEHLQTVNSGPGPRCFIVQGATSGLQPVQIAGLKVEIVSQGIAVVESPRSVFEEQ